MVVPLTSRNANRTLDSWKAKRLLIARKLSVPESPSSAMGLLAISLPLNRRSILVEVVTLGF